jgi:isopenicillin N synthase-like dioxygenase
MVETIKDDEFGMYADFDNRYLRQDTRFGIERAALARLPVIDLSPFLASGSRAERLRVAAALRAACIDIGFFYLIGHGIAQAELDELVAWGHRFFDLPIEEKMKVHKGPSVEGFMRVGGLNPEANPDKAADLKERLTMVRGQIAGEPALAGRRSSHNQWPNERLLPGFAAFMTAHVARRVRVAQGLARAFALALDLAEDHFDSVYRYPSCTLILNYYPQLNTGALERTRWSFSPHTDYCTFTLLSQDSLGGLQVRNSAGEWIDVPPVDGSLVVNIGDLFAMWTNDLFSSNLHRAANTSGKARISVPLFVSPQDDTVIRCLPTCQNASNPPRYEPVESANYLGNLVAQSYRTGRVGVAVRTAERFQKAAGTDS